MNIINKLPFELNNLILDFCCGECNKCNKTFSHDQLNFNCVIFQYYSVFEEDYYFQKNPQKYKYLCTHCKKEYYQTKEKTINGEILLFDYCPLK